MGGLARGIWMALNRARTAMDAGDLRAARRALEFAVSHYQNPEPEAVRLLGGDHQRPGDR